MMLQITNLTKSKIDEKLLQKAAQAAFAVFRKKREEVSLVFVGESKMKEINQKYRQKNKTTDVLSFEKLNEIFICLTQAKKQAKISGNSLNCELTRLLVHGIVHLKGYDHERGAKDAEEMFNLENKILKKAKF